MKQVWVEAPGSSANLGPGFDVFALALESIRDKIHLKVKPSETLSVRIRDVKGATVPSSANENGAGVVCLTMGESCNLKADIEIELDKGIPIGRGMGSSGASAAAAAVAMNHVFDLRLSQDEMIFYAGEGERVTSGAPHYDNVSASIAGGFVIVKGGGRPSAIRFGPPVGMIVCLATPLIDLPKRKTEYARSILPKTVPMGMMVSNVASASLIVSGFALGDVELIGKGMEDRVVEQARKSMIPCYDAVKASAIGTGAVGVCISGAGPTVLAVVDERRSNPGAVLNGMTNAFLAGGIKSVGLVTKTGEGARVVKSS